MENKKNPKYDLERKSPLFFAFGLMVALLCVTVAFEWKSEYDPMELPSSEDHFPPPIEIPITSFPKPEPPKPKEKIEEIVKPEQIKEIVEVETEEIQKVLKTEPLDEPLGDLPIIDMDDEEAEEPVDFASVMPSYPGGINAFYKYVGKNVEYSSQAKRLGISGKVFVQFVIDKNGELIDLKIIRGIDEELDNQVLEVLKNSPRWSPGRQGNQLVKVRMVLPITFSLNY